jgi:hypothetical protein
MSLCACGCGQPTPIGRYTRPARGLQAGKPLRFLPGHVWRKHGAAALRTPTYIAWRNLRSRCENKKDIGWHNYGGRGIKVCAQWRRSFLAFLADMGERPEGMSLDRIDVNGNYEPANCRWASTAQQSSNRRSNVWIEHDGAKRTVSEWSQITGIGISTLTYRLSLGKRPPELFRAPHRGKPLR